MAIIVYPSGSGLTLPTSGELVGVFAGFLRIKGAVTATGAGPAKTAERYYRGEPVREGSVKTILDTLVSSTLPAQLVDDEALGVDFDVNHWARDLVTDLAARWDRLASSLNGSGFPIIEETTAPLPFLRMVALDTGLRWGAYQALRFSRGHEPVVFPIWLSRRALAAVMDQFLPPGKTLGDLRRDLLVDRNTMDSWRAGTSSPSDSNLKLLAAAFAKMIRRPRDEILATLRIAVGVGAAVRCLENWVDDEHQVNNLIEGFRATARSSFDYFRWLPLPMSESKRIAALREVVQCGARASVGPAACSSIAQLCIPMSQEIALDLQVLPRDWTDRINYWFQQLGARESAERTFAAQSQLAAKEVQNLIKAAIAMMMSMRDFDRRPLPDNVIVVKHDDRGKAQNRIIHAQREWSAGNISKAFEHLDRAIELQPDEAPYRFMHGAWLGELVEAGHLGHLNASLASLRRALALDPSHHVAATEVGIVFFNAGLVEEAEQAFANAADLSSGSHRFHYARARALMALGRWEPARTCLERALELEPRDQTVRMFLAAVLMKMGESNGAKLHAREVRHRSGEDPLTSWEELLERRPNRTVRWQKRVDGSWFPADAP